MQLAREVNVKIGGVDYKLSKFQLPLYNEFLVWAKDKLPDPYEGLAERVKGLDEKLAKYIIDKCDKKATVRGTVNDPDVEALMASLDGIKKILTLLFRKYQPSLSEAQVIEIVEAGLEEHGEDFFRPFIETE